MLDIYTNMQVMPSQNPDEVGVREPWKKILKKKNLNLPLKLCCHNLISSKGGGSWI